MNPRRNGLLAAAALAAFAASAPLEGVTGKPKQDYSAYGRFNKPCPCGSGKKFKRCCYGKRNALPQQTGDA